MNICYETFGCRLNRAEALEDEAQCLALGHKFVKTHREADAIVVRGCSVTSRAQYDCEKLIAHLRKRYPNTPVYVTGCLKGASPIPFRKEGCGVPTSTARAYLKVQDGCDGACSFCIVPKFRGKSVSASWDAVLDKAKRFIDAGYHELVVTGCNLCAYRSGERRLAELTDALASLDAGVRVRLGSLEPGAVADAVVDAVAAHDNVCRFLHLSVQSGSGHILAAMRRPYRVRDVHELAGKIRRLMPDANLGCDMIGGFPGETEIDHTLSLDLIRQRAFTNVHAFPYSVRPGTPAEKMKSMIAPEVRSARAKELVAAGEAQRKLLIKRFVGHKVSVLIESDRHVSGWTDEYLPFRALEVRLRPGETLRKELHTFRVSEVRDGILRGFAL